MTTEELANQPVKLPIEGVDANGDPVKLSFVLARSLPTAAATALDRDLLAIGKRNLTPHERLRPQLDSLWAKAKAARQSNDADSFERFMASWNRMHDRLHDTIISGKADDLAIDVYWGEGRKCPEGLCREIIERAKHVPGAEPVNAAELRAVVTDGNAGLVFASLQEALGEIGGSFTAGN